MSASNAARHAAVTTAFSVLNDPAIVSMPASEVGSTLSERLQKSVATLGPEGDKIAKSMIANIKQNASQRGTAEGVISVAQTVFTALGDAAPAPFSSVFSVLGAIAGVAQKVMANQKAVASLAERFISLNPILLEIHARATAEASDIVQSKSLDIVRRMVAVFEEARDLIQRFVAPAEEEASDSKGGGGWFGSRLVNWAKEKFVEISHSPEDFELVHANLDRVLADFNFAKIATLLPAPTSAELVEMARVDAAILQEACEARLKQAMKDASDEVKVDIQRAQAQLTAEFKHSIGTMSAQLDTIGVMIKTMLQEKTYNALRLEEHEVRLFGKVAKRPGGTGEVLEATLGGTTVVAKRSTATSETEAMDILKEADLLMQLQHPNIVRCYGIVVKSQRTYLLLERCNLSVSTVLRLSGALPPIPAAFVLLKVSAALRTLHQRKHAHLDINAHNVMLKANGEISLIDFGSATTLAGGSDGASKSANHKKKAAHMDCSTVSPMALFVAPETLDASHKASDVATAKSDVYSFGMLMYELLSGGPPFDGDERPLVDIIHAARVNQERPPLTSCARAPPPLLQLMQQCWSHDADDRPLMSTVHALLDQFLLSQTNGGAAGDEYNRFLADLGVSGLQVSADLSAVSSVSVKRAPSGTQQPASPATVDYKIPHLVRRFRKFAGTGKPKSKEYVAFLQQLGRKGTTIQELNLYITMQSQASPSEGSDVEGVKRKMDEAMFVKFFVAWLETVFEKIAAPRKEVDIVGLKAFLEAIQKPQTDDSLPFLLKHVDVNVNGLLSFDEIVVLVNALHCPSDDDEDEEDDEQVSVPAPVPAPAVPPAVVAAPPLTSSNHADHVQVQDAPDCKERLIKALETAKSNGRAAVAKVLIDFAPPTIQSAALAELLMKAVYTAVVEGDDSAPVITAFTTLSARQALWSLAHTFAAADAAGSFGHVIRKLAGSNVDQKKLFVSNPSRDALVSAAQKATTAEFAGLIAEALAALVADNDDQRKCFGTIAVRGAVVSLLHATKSSPKDLKASLSAMCYITINDDNEKLYAMPEVISALVACAPFCASQSDVAEAFGNALRNLTVNEENRVLFSTQPISAAIVQVIPGCTSAGAVRMICGAISNLTAKEKKLLGTTNVRDGLVKMSKYADTQIAIRFMGNAITNITVDDENEKLYATGDIRDALVALAGKCTEPLTVQWIATAMRNVATHADHKPLFGTAAVRDALVKLAKGATTADAVRFVAGAIAAIAEPKPTKPLYGTEAVRSAVVALGAAASTTLSARFIFTALATILVDDDNEKFYAIPPVRDLFVKLAKLCSGSTDGIQRWGLALRNLTVNTDNKKIIGTPEIRDAMVEVMAGATTAVDVLAIVRTVCTISNQVDNRKMLHNVPFRDGLVRLASLVTEGASSASEAAKFFSDGVSNITIDDENELLYSTDAMLGVFLKNLIPAATAGESAAAVGGALRNLSHAAANKGKFATAPVRDAVLQLCDKVNSDLGCNRCCYLIGKVAAAPEARPLFCNERSRSAIITMSSYATTSDAAKGVCVALGFISIDNDCEAFYATEQIRDVIVRLSKLVTTADAAERVLQCVDYLTTAVANRAVFITDSVRDLLLALAPLATLAECVRHFGSALLHLTKDDVANQFVTPQFRDAFVSMEQYATTPTSIRGWANGVFASSRSAPGKVVYGTSSIRDAILSLSARASSADDVVVLGKAVVAISVNDDAEKVFATAAMRDVIVNRWVPLATTADSSAQVASALTNLSFAAPHKALFGTTAVRDALVVLLNVGDKAIGPITNISKTMSMLCNAEGNISLFAGLRERMAALKTFVESGAAEGTTADSKAAAEKALTAILEKLK